MNLDKYYVSSQLSIARSTPNATKLKDLPLPALLLLLAITIAGATLRILYQHGRPFIGDEVGTLIYIAKDYKFLLTNFIDPWMTMNYYLVAIKTLGTWMGNNPWVLVMPSLLAGTIMIPMVSSLTLRLSTQKTALFAAFFTAINPFLLYFSVKIRSYSLFLAFTLGSLIFFFDWLRTQDWKSGFGCAICSLFALLFHPNAAYHLVFLIILFLIWFFRNNKREWIANKIIKSTSLALPMLLTLGLTIFAYAHLVTPMKIYWESRSSSTLARMDYLPLMFNEYFAPGFYAMPFLLFLGIGLWQALKEKRLLMLLSLGIIIPILLSIISGSDYVPWARLRFLITILPLLIIFIAEGASTVAKYLPRFSLYLLALVFIYTGSYGLKAHFLLKNQEPWIKVSDHLIRNMQQGDLILPLGMFTSLNLTPYFKVRQFARIDENFFNSPSQSSPTNLFVVNLGVPIQTTFPNKTFGRIQVIKYSETSRSNSAESLRKDLLSSKIQSLVYDIQHLEIVTQKKQSDE